MVSEVLRPESTRLRSKLSVVVAAIVAFVGVISAAARGWSSFQGVSPTT
jgi:hypothetical protein